MCELCVPSTHTRRDLLKLGAASALGAPLLFSGSASAQDLAITVADGLTINRRAAWAGVSNTPKGNIPAEEVKFLLVHHTADRLEHTQDEVPAILRGYYGFHTSAEKGWPDIAYNFMIDRFGQVWETHDGSIANRLQGYATGGNQGYSQLVCLIGNFTAEMPTEAARSSLVRTLAWLSDRDQIDTGPGATTTFVSRGSNRHPAGATVETPTITGHRMMSATTCPGDAFFPFVERDLAGLVTAHRTLAASTPTSTTSTPTSTTSTTSTPPEASSTSVGTSLTASTIVHPTNQISPPIPTESAGESVAERAAPSDSSVITSSRVLGAAGIMVTAALSVVLFRRRELAPPPSER